MSDIEEKMNINNNTTRIKEIKTSSKGITLIALVITIIVLLILTGVSIAMLTGENGILTQSTEAKKANTLGAEKEQIQLAMQSLKMKKQANNVSTVVTLAELQKQFLDDGAKNVTVENGENNDLVVNYKDSKNSYIINQDGIIEYNGKNETIEQPENVATNWEVISETDKKWYSYKDLSNGDKTVKINPPKLGGNMKPIRYVGLEAYTQIGSKWANAMTTDGSMWVWIPRYAYKITEGYHTNKAGTIEVAFIDTNNNFLNGETGELTSNPEEEGAGITKWLVHPAFTTNVAYGGGFGEIPGLWVGKFETTGEYSNGDASKVTVKPGEVSLRNMIVNDQYKVGMKATYGESVNLKSHMAKNSEWGAIVYLAHSKYGTNKQKIEQNINSSFYTGGTNTIEEIYTTNKKQSTTHNATGVYDLNGGADESVASYANYTGENLRAYGGTRPGDLYGETDYEQAASTEYKTVYIGTNNVRDYETAKKNKGDAVYETSLEHTNWEGTWFEKSGYFPCTISLFFSRGGNYSYSHSGSFSFNGGTGSDSEYVSFRVVLIP